MQERLNALRVRVLYYYLQTQGQQSVTLPVARARRLLDFQHGEPVEIEAGARSPIKVEVKGGKVQASLCEAAHSDAELVFLRWREATSRPKAKFTPDRKRRVLSRLREGYTAEQLCQAVDGMAGSPWHRGKNKDGRRYDDLELCCRSGSYVEKFIEMGERQVRRSTPAAETVLPEGFLAEVQSDEEEEAL